MAKQERTQRTQNMSFYAERERERGNKQKQESTKINKAKSYS
jgi:hypothetical protein